MKLYLFPDAKVFYGVVPFSEMNNFKSAEVWSPCEQLQQPNTLNYGIMVLNTPITTVCNPLVIHSLWNQAQVRITVDGGTEKWLQWIQKYKRDKEEVLLPDIITGDMDSLPKNVLNYFISKNDNIKVVVTPDQDETDFFKALRELSSYCLKKHLEINNVFVLVDSCGRLDQILANLNTLYKSSEIMNETKIFLLGSNSLTWLLLKGEHVINIPSLLRENHEWCALLPIASSCKVTTTGLKWNLSNETLSFGGIVSSSNTYDGSPSVYIQTDKPLIWSMGIHRLLEL